MSMTHPGMWVHALPNILLNGLTEHKDVEGEDEDFNQEEANEAQKAKDPYEKRLKPITQDAKVKISEKIS